MKKTFATVSCALAIIMALPFVGSNTQLGQVGVDVVSAATGDSTPTKTTTPAKTTTPVKKTTTKTTTKKTTTSKASTPIKVATEVKRLLAFGSYGGDVMLVQTKLNENGYKLKVDGIYGKLTKAAVKSYQSKKGLKADGIIGPKTLGKLTPAKPAPVKTTPTPVVTKPVTPTPTTPTPDAVTSASVTDNIAVFEKSIGKDGKWIIATTKDLVSSKELVVEGDIYNTKTPPALQRKIALYTQDDNKVVIDEFTLTAPKLTIKSPNARIQNGTFKGKLNVEVADFQLVSATVVGDVYVSAKGFKMTKDAKVEGNIYFTTQEAKDSFVIEDTSSVTGSQILTQVDVVATASIVNNAAAFEKAIGTEGKWIAAITRDLTFTKELILDGEFQNTKTPPVTMRKVALYAQDSKRNTTHKFTLTAPKLTIKSPAASLQKGIFKGDIYVTTTDFQLVETKVEGNIYFISEAAKAGFIMDDKSSVTGKLEVK